VNEAVLRGEGGQRSATPFRLNRKGNNSVTESRLRSASGARNLFMFGCGKPPPTTNRSNNKTMKLSRNPRLGFALAGVLALTAGANGGQDVLPSIPKGSIALNLKPLAIGLSAPA
jgi:hypothetical protein